MWIFRPDCHRLLSHPHSGQNIASPDHHPASFLPCATRSAALLDGVPTKTPVCR